MSEVFEGYERQYREISAALSRKCAAASALDGEKKKQKLPEIQADVQESESLIRKMDLEARSLQPTVRAGLLSKLREYKSDLNNIKSEIKKVSAPNAQQATREELLDSGMPDTLGRGRLMMTSERLNQSSDRIRESQITALDTEEIGVSILQNLHNQRETLMHAHKTLHGVDDSIGKSNKILASMSKWNKWFV
ncbi:vesicle transport v-SNARE 11 isoform X2 [Triticum aestivum]|uniref:vesicle transport v-SNARE 11 isoform X2 n=1 Tax=Triticum aestivum TaxID=4565 RepID=UPI001D017399|nr:vesicle transport v-SNARE 11-like isoform X2 [Triticum aestivum]